MPTQRLVIDGPDQEAFFLSVRDGTLTVSADPAHAELVLGKARVVRIHCEVEVEEGLVIVGEDGTAETPPRELHPGETFQLGHAQVGLVAGATEELVHEAPTPGVGRRLIVTDGADRKRCYPLPEAGSVTIGKSAKLADIVLHDLYVAQVHCEVQVEGERVLVTHREGSGGTIINGQRITTQELHPGDILRVGNSHLRLELDTAEPRPAAGAEAAAKPDTPTLPAAPSIPPADELLKLENQALGQYQFGALLGRGRSGLIFRAHHRQTNQAVAVKVLSPEFPGSDAEVQGFVRALKAAAPLRHPHLVTLYGAGKTGHLCWVAREYIEGESLAKLIARLQEEGGFGWKRACRVAVHLAKLLDYLEQHQVAHATLTPWNILIQKDTRTTKLADVMLQQALQGSRLLEKIRDKKWLAELPYTAPEQTDAKAPADHRARLYALGSLLYALLVGQPPFTGKTAEEIIAQARDGKVVKPSKVLRDTPAPFEAAVLKLLARRVEERYQTAGELLADVEPIANIHEIKL